MADRDETYIIDLCDRVLNLKAKRQHRLAFLRGDAGTRLPVDAYYEELKLVVEYCETQHTNAVPIMDKRITVSGVSRAEQRRKYDQLRDRLLPLNGICIVRLDYRDFSHYANCRLKRDTLQDEEVIRAKLLQENALGNPGVAGKMSC